MKRTIFQILVLTAALFSCREEESKSSTQYLIINQVDNVGNISLFEMGNEKFSERFYTREGGLIHNAHRNGDFLFIYANALFEFELAKIDLIQQKEIESVQVWPGQIPFIDSFEKNVIMVHRPYFDEFTPHINVYNESLALKDSITLKDDAQVNAAKVIGNRLYLGLNDINRSHYLKVLDLGTFAVIDSLPLSGRCLNILPMSDNNILIAQTNKLDVVNSVTMAIEKTTPGIFNVAKGIAVNAEKDEMYFLNENAQPAPTLYSLYKKSLSSGESTLLVSFPEVVGTPILYDVAEDMIITGGGFRIFSTDGNKVYDAKDAPNTTSHLIKW